MKENEKNIRGILEKIVFKNPDSGYMVGRIRLDNNEQVTIVGNVFELQCGEELEIEGSWIVNKTYGKQFEIKKVKTYVPATTIGIENYLGSGLIKGIGPVIAKKIVGHFGEETLDILDNDPEALSGIEGIGQKRIKQIIKSWQEHKKIREVMIFLQSYGISSAYAAKIYNTYGENAVSVIKVNPYRLAEDIFGIGFKTADDIALKAGISKDSMFRIKAGIIYMLRRAEDNGHCFLPGEEVITVSADFLEADLSIINESIRELQKDERIIVVKGGGEEKIYLRSLYNCENYVGTKILELTGVYPDMESRDSKKSAYIKIIGELADANDILLDGIQISAITMALTEKIMIITGSPGTGKSTILNFIIKILEREKKRVLMAAPTGRASKRMTETTGKEAKTIHRLLNFNPKLNQFLKNEENPLDADVVIIDEASMLDIRLMQSLLSAIKRNTNLIFVGDIDQLPSVGPGYVLGDLIGSGTVPVCELKKIYRQEGQSQIIKNAHKVRDGEFPYIKNTESGDFFFVEKNDPEDAVNLILHLLTNKIPSSFGMDPLNDVQVLVPTNKGVCGVINLNSRIQKVLNPGSTGLLHRNRLFKTGDKVIQLKNNYDKEVYNGDIGIIKNINMELKEIRIEYEGRMVEYSFYEMDEINHSYAISIHKSQGSEFRCIIIPLLTSHYMLLQRNLLYTALTRARELAILVGSKKAIGMAVSKNVVEKRYTSLKELIQV
ncbi:MAG: ATP-dependent RecD-like DNA helicase [Actinobacteria bacterium]|nr:ATP-dependent RecD-like DNA helicase [Actinomycetota bacterium]